jgi:enamine deaminase RidA (YjgF/YER057c/UK114 family)
MLTDINRWEEAAKAHSEFFWDIRPASTFVAVPRLISNDWLVEIEAECLVTD